MGVVAGRDHTLVAAREGNVRIHFEIEGARRFISVDDGSMCNELFGYTFALLICLDIPLKIRSEIGYWLKLMPILILA